MSDKDLNNNGYLPTNDGYEPVKKGYQPTSTPAPSAPSEGQPGAGYQPEVNQGENPGNPPSKP